MTEFSSTDMASENKLAFSGAESAECWLASQPRANAQVMLPALVAQIEAFNRYPSPPRERFKTMEVLRKTVFAVCNECQRRYEYRPLPFSSSEQQAFDMVCRLWRACAIAYQYCLRGCLEGDASIASHGARVAHRVMSCLRMEQMNCYAAAIEPGAGFWRSIHAILVSAERLGIAGQPLEDRLLGETRESTVTGQYVMALLLHLSRPFSLLPGQFAAVTRWLARWRGQAEVLDQPDPGPKSCSLPLDLTQDRPICDGVTPAKAARWLSLGNVQRKIRRRLEALAAGDSPESLKLGGGLSVEACVALLETLGDRLKHPPLDLAGVAEDRASLSLGAGMANIYRLLGGEGLENVFKPDSTNDNRLAREQLAVFGHVVRSHGDVAGGVLENWRLALRGNGELFLERPAGAAGARLSLKSLLAIRQDDAYVLATIASLHMGRDGGLCLTASLLSEEAQPLVAEIREKRTGQTTRHPAFLLWAAERGVPSGVFLPAGLAARASILRFFDGREQSALDMRLSDCLARGGEIERWAIVPGPMTWGRITFKHECIDCPDLPA